MKEKLKRAFGNCEACPRERCAIWFLNGRLLCRTCRDAYKGPNVSPVPAVESSEAPVEGSADPLRKAQSRLIHIAADIAMMRGFISPYAADNPKTTPQAILQQAGNQEVKMKDWAHEISEVARSLTKQPFPSSVAVGVESVDHSMPLCPTHQRLDDIDALVVSYGNGCVACSLNERQELLNVLAERLQPGRPYDSVAFLRHALSGSAQACPECGHSFVSANGKCLVAKNFGDAPCGCKCVFPTTQATEQSSDSELHRERGVEGQASLPESFDSAARDENKTSG